MTRRILTALEQVAIWREALDWHSHEPEQRRTQLKDFLPSDPTWLEPTDSDWYNNGTANWDEDDPRFYMEDEDYDPVTDPDFDPTPRQRGINTDELNRKQRIWYHVSPHELAPGTELKGGARPSFDSERGMYRKPEPVVDEFENPLKLPPADASGRPNSVFVAPQLKPSSAELDRFLDMNPHLDEATSNKYFQGDAKSATWWKHHMYDVRSPWNMRLRDNPAGAAHIYEVKPHGRPQPWNLNYGLGYATPGATVLRKVDPSEYQEWWPDRKKASA